MLVNPSSPRLTLDSDTYGVAVTCGSRALNCCQRCPPAELMSELESNRPRFCLRPRSMAFCIDNCIVPGTSFVETLPAKGLTPDVPGMA